MEHSSIGIAFGKKLLYASASFSTHDLRFLNSFVENGWHVIFARFDGLQQQLCTDGVPDGVDQVEWVGTREKLADSNLFEFHSGFRRLVQDLTPDLILAGPIPNIGFIATQITSVPVVLISWASDLLCDIHLSINNLEQAQYAISRSSGIIADCQTVAKIAENLGGQKSKMLTMPWGISLEKFTVGKSRVADGVFRVVSVRSLEEIYDVKTLLFAVAYLRKVQPTFKFVVSIVGSGTEELHLKELARTLNLDDFVEWSPRINEDDLRTLILKHDLYISTSKSDGSSISMLQALAIGQLVLVSNIPSNLEWIIDGWNGWVFDVGDSEHLARQIFEISEYQFKADISARTPSLVQERADWQVNQRRLTEFLIGCLTI